MKLKLTFLLVTCVLSWSVSAHTCAEKYCSPQNGDLSIGRVLQVEGSCNNSLLCTSEDIYLNDGDADTDWVSDPGLQNATIQLNLETSFRFIGVNISFVSFLPAAAVLEVSSDNAETWRPVQFYATDCLWHFQMPDSSPNDRPDITDVICTPDFTIPLQTGGNLLFDLLLPHHLPFWATDPLQLSLPVSDLTITNLRLRMLALQPINSLVPISYHIHSFQIYGACHCFGHASTCVAAEGYEEALVPGVCECRHNTQGEHCEMCLDGYNNKRWGPSTPIYTSFCERCDCNSHSDKCHYDIEQEKQICDDCQDSTTGDRCELCKAGYFQNPNYVRAGSLFLPDICSDCNCDPRGALTPLCNRYGYCKCKKNVMGPQCNRCKPGFYGLNASNPDGCRPCVCGEGARGCDPVSGRCMCKKYADGLMCQTCINGYYGPFPNDRFGCRFCGCTPGTTLLPRKCDADTGTCLCREGVEGDTCSLVTDGYFVEEITQDDVDSRVQPMCGRGDTVACDLAGIWFDESTQTRRCEEDISGEKCCSYAQKIISIFLNNGATPCSCHSNGSVSSSLCDKCGGQCDCKSYTGGRDCSQCSAVEKVCEMCPRASPTIGDCINCFCNGFSQDCSVARGWSRYLISLDVQSQDWLSNQQGFVEIAEAYNPFSDRTELHPRFRLDSDSVSITLPSQYLGNRRHSYAAELSLSLNLNFVHTSMHLLLETTEYIVIRDITSLSRPLITAFDVELVEEGFVQVPSSLPASEYELRRLLTELTSIQLVIGGSPIVGGSFVSLFQADLWDSVSEGTGEVSGSVEVCQCPDEYMGQFCERCSPGYTRTPNSGGQFALCVSCACNGHSATCNPEDGSCTNCQDNTRGRFCDECQEGFYGDPTSPLGCLPCLCPTGPSSPYQVSNSCSAVDATRPENGHTCDCPSSYAGQNCEACAEGHRGDPVSGVPCERCDVCYDQYVALTEVIQTDIAVLDQFILSCVNWQDGFDFFELFRANLTELSQLITRVKLSNSSTVCQLRSGLSETSEYLSEITEVLNAIISLDATANVEKTQQLIEEIIPFVSSLQNVTFTNIFEGILNSGVFDLAYAQFAQSQSLLNTSNSLYQTAVELRFLLSKASASISRITQLYLSIDVTEFPDQLAAIETHMNVISEVSTAARVSLCGDSEACEDGTYQRIRLVASQLQYLIVNLTARKDSLIDPIDSFTANVSVFEDLLSRLSILREIVIPLNVSVCELVPLVHESISSVNSSIDQSADVNELTGVSSEILQLTLSLTLTETYEVAVFINSTLNVVLNNEVLLQAGVGTIELPPIYLTDLTTHYNQLKAAYDELLALSPDITTHTQSVTQLLTQLQTLRQQIANLTDTVQQIISDVIVLDRKVPLLTYRVGNLTIAIENVLRLREDNQQKLSDAIRRASELNTTIQALGVKASTLIPQADEIVTETQDINNTVMQRFRTLNLSYPLLQTLRATLALQTAKLQELQAFADSLSVRQDALEALLTRTEDHLDTHVLTGQLQEIDSTAKCLNYAGES